MIFKISDENNWTIDLQKTYLLIEKTHLLQREFFCYPLTKIVSIKVSNEDSPQKHLKSTPPKKNKYLLLGSFVSFTLALISIFLYFYYQKGTSELKMVPLYISIGLFVISIVFLALYFTLTKQTIKEEIEHHHETLLIIDNDKDKDIAKLQFFSPNAIDYLELKKLARAVNDYKAGNYDGVYEEDQHIEEIRTKEMIENEKKLARELENKKRKTTIMDALKVSKEKKLNKNEKTDK